MRSILSEWDSFGFTGRFWGLTLDNVLSATVVLANGTIVQASNESYPDLFWVSRLPPCTANSEC